MAANVVEVVVTASNQTAAGFGAAKAGADETAASMDTLAVATARVDEANVRYAQSTGALLDAQLRLADVEAKEGATDAEIAAARDKVTAATIRQADAQIALLNAEAKQEAAAAASADASVAGSAKVSAAATEAADAQKAAGDAAVASGAKADAAGGLMAGMGGKVKVAGIATAVGMGLAVKGAMDFQAQTTRLVTSAGEVPTKLAMVQQGMLALSAQTDTSTSQMASGMYTIESAGFHGANGLTVLKAAAQGAKDEGADLATVSNAVTDALVDFHEPASSAANVTSQLIAAVSHGKTTFEEFSGSMSTILPLASAMHLKLADVSGVLAEMTAHGISAQEASQQEANAMRMLMKPNAAMVKEFTALGITSDEVYKKLGTAGLGGTMQWLSGVAKDGAGKIGQNYTEALGKLMGTAPGLQVALATTGENAKGTNAAIKGIASASADAQGNVDGFSKVSDTLAFKMGAAEQSIKATGISLGEALLPAVSAVMGPIAHMLQLVASNKVAADAFAVVVGGILATALGSKLVSGLRDVKAGIEGVGSGAQWLIGKLMAMTGAQEAQTAATEAATVAQGELDAAEDANPIGLIVIAIAALIAIIVLLVTHLHEVARVFDIVRHAVASAFDAMRHDVAAAVTAVVKLIGDGWRKAAGETQRLWHDVVSFFTRMGSGARRLASDVASFFARMWSDVTGLVSRGVSEVLSWAARLFSDFLSTEERGIANIVHWFAGLPGRILSAVGDLGSLLFSGGVRIVQGLINGVMSMAGSVGHAIGSVVSDIRSYLPFSPAKKGPLSGAGAPENSGRSIARLLAQGMTSGLPDVHGAASRMASAASAAASARYGTAGYGGYGAGGTATVRAQLEISGSAEDMFVRAIREAVRTIGGGDVQAAFGGG